MVAKNKLGDTIVTTPSEREVLVKRVIDAPRWLVFETYTDPRHLPNWMLGPRGWTMPVCEVDLSPGGEFRFVWRSAEGSEMEISGVYEEISAPERIVTTERWGGEWPETRNTLVLTELNGKTTTATTLLYPSKEARDAALRTGMTEGMSQSFARLDEYLRMLGASPTVSL